MKAFLSSTTSALEAGAPSRSSDMRGGGQQPFDVDSETRAEQALFVYQYVQCFANISNSELLNLWISITERASLNACESIAVFRT